MAGAEVRLEVLRSLEQAPAARAETIDVAVLLAAMLVQTAFGGEDLPPARRHDWLTHAKERWRGSAHLVAEVAEVVRPLVVHVELHA